MLNGSELAAAIPEPLSPAMVYDFECDRTTFHSAIGFADNNSGRVVVVDTSEAVAELRTGLGCYKDILELSCRPGEIIRSSDDLTVGANLKVYAGDGSFSSKINTGTGTGHNIPSALFYAVRKALGTDLANLQLLRTAHPTPDEYHGHPKQKTKLVARLRGDDGYEGPLLCSEGVSDTCKQLESDLDAVFALFAYRVKEIGVDMVLTGMPIKD